MTAVFFRIYAAKTAAQMFSLFRVEVQFRPKSIRLSKCRLTELGLKPNQQREKAACSRGDGVSMFVRGWS